MSAPRRLPILCAQDYSGMDMQVSRCTRCQDYWDREGKRCTVATGCEHLPEVAQAEVPTCPIQERCQHQIQALPGPCPVRARGMICESALGLSGVACPPEHPLAYNANTIASPEEWAARVREMEENGATR